MEKIIDLKKDEDVKEILDLNHIINQENVLSNLLLERRRMIQTYNQRILEKYNLPPETMIKFFPKTLQLVCNIPDKTEKVKVKKTNKKKKE